MSTSTPLIPRHIPCSDAPQNTKSIKESTPRPWGTKILRFCKQERLNKKSRNELNSARSKEVCNECWDQRRIWTFEQERKRRYSVGQRNNSNFVQAGRPTCSPSCLEWFPGSSGGSTTLNSLRALKDLPSIQCAELFSTSDWRVRVNGKSRFKEYSNMDPLKILSVKPKNTYG